MIRKESGNITDINKMLFYKYEVAVPLSLHLKKGCRSGQETEKGNQKLLKNLSQVEGLKRFSFLRDKRACVRWL